MYDREPLYVISVAARLLEMHAQTLRKYEREGFIEPSRTRGRLRLYSAEDIERLRQIKYLVEERNLNLAGVELALTLSRRLRALHESVRAARSVEEATARFEEEARDILALLGLPEPDWRARAADDARGRRAGGPTGNSAGSPTGRAIHAGARRSP